MHGYESYVAALLNFMGWGAQQQMPLAKCFLTKLAPLPKSPWQAWQRDFENYGPSGIDTAGELCCNQVAWLLVL
jgi:hypothetical protein